MAGPDPLDVNLDRLRKALTPQTSGRTEPPSPLDKGGARPPLLARLAFWRT